MYFWKCKSEHLVENFGRFSKISAYKWKPDQCTGFRYLPSYFENDAIGLAEIFKFQIIIILFKRDTSLLEIKIFIGWKIQKYVYYSIFRIDFFLIKKANVDNCLYL